MVKSYIVKAGQNHTTRPDSEFERAEHVLTSWNTSPDGTGVSVPCLSTFMPRNDMTLYAQWKKELRDVTVNVFSYDNNYDTTIAIGTDQYFTTSQANSFQWLVNKTGSITVTRSTQPYPAVIIVPSGGKISGKSYLTDLDTTKASKTFAFNSSDFTVLDVVELGVDYGFEFSGTAHTASNQFEGLGKIVGGFKYIFQWYDTYKFIKSGKKSSPVDWTFVPSSTSFINVAHKGTNTAHVMYAKMLMRDDQTGDISALTQVFTCTGLEASTGNNNKNFHTLEFPNIEVDLRDPSYKFTDTFSLGVQMKDQGSGCTGIKFSGKYKVTVIERD